MNEFFKDRFNQIWFFVAGPSFFVGRFDNVFVWILGSVILGFITYIVSGAKDDDMKKMKEHD